MRMQYIIICWRICSYRSYSWGRAGGRKKYDGKLVMRAYFCALLHIWLLFLTVERCGTDAIYTLKPISRYVPKMIFSNSVWLNVNLEHRYVTTNLNYLAPVCLHVGFSLYTHLWLMGSVWGSLAASAQKRWRSPVQRGSWRSWGRQTAGWTVPLLWSYQTRCRKELPGQGQAERQTGRWIYPQGPAAASWQLHTGSHVCCPPRGPIRDQQEVREPVGDSSPSLHIQRVSHVCSHTEPMWWIRGPWNPSDRQYTSFSTTLDCSITGIWVSLVSLFFKMQLNIEPSLCAELHTFDSPCTHLLHWNTSTEIYLMANAKC